MNYNRFLPLLIPVIALALSETFFFWPRMIYVAITLIILAFWFAVRQFIKAGSRDEKWWNFLILPFCFWGGLTALSIMIPNKILVQLLFVLGAIFLYIYYRAIYYYLIIHGRDQKYSPANIFFYIAFLSIFFISSAIFGLQAFLNTPVWLLALAILFVFGLIIYQVIWASEIDIRAGFLFIFIGCIITVELIWALSFLPLSFYIEGFILALCFYIFMGLTRFYLQYQLSGQIIKRYLIFGFLSMLVVLLTARWR